jgi:hypothetical protein
MRMRKGIVVFSPHMGVKWPNGVEVLADRLVRPLASSSWTDTRLAPFRCVVLGVIKRGFLPLFRHFFPEHPKKTSNYSPTFYEVKSVIVTIC